MGMLRIRRATLQAYTFSAVCLVAFVGSGCAGTSSPATIVCGTCEEPGRFVRLQAYDSQAFLVNQGGFSHPLNLGPKDWKPILASIRVYADLFFPIETTEQPAFTPEEIDYLSMTLSRAFAKAEPRDWVIFSLSQPSPASVTEMTTGAWYAEGMTLHLLLANYRAAVSMNNIRDVLERDPLFDVFGSPRYNFLLTEHSKEGSEKKSLLSSLKQKTPHLAIEYTQLLAAVTISKNVQRAGKDNDEVGPRTTDASDHSPSNFENRLARLKRLKEKELITEEDYQRRKKALLDQM